MADRVQVPVEATVALCAFLTGYGSGETERDLDYMTERDRAVIMERGRARWARILEIATSGVSSPSVTEQEVTRALERHCLRTDSAEARKDMRKALEGFVSDRTAGVQEGRYQASCTKDADES